MIWWFLAGLAVIPGFILLACLEEWIAERLHVKYETVANVTPWIVTPILTLVIMWGILYG